MFLGSWRWLVNRESRDRLRSDATDYEYDKDDYDIWREINVAAPALEAMEGL